MDDIVNPTEEFVWENVSESFQDGEAVSNTWNSTWSQNTSYGFDLSAEEKAKSYLIFKVCTEGNLFFLFNHF